MGKRFKFSGFILLMGIIVISFNGCNLVKRTVGVRKSMKDGENIVTRVVNSQEDWKFMEIRLTGKADEDGNKIGFMGTVKMERDKQIYVLLRSNLGIEVARVYATRDSVWMISRILGITEKGDWKLIAGKVGYPVDFYAMQGILVQGLFTSAGDQVKDLVENLVVKSNKEDLRLVSNANMELEGKGIKYFNEFVLSRETFMIQDSKIRDIKGQWIADVKYMYSPQNVIKKIELKGIDSERNFAVDVNVIKREIKDNLEINFDKF